MVSIVSAFRGGERKSSLFSVGFAHSAGRGSMASLVMGLAAAPRWNQLIFRLPLTLREQELSASIPAQGLRQI